MLFLTNTIPNFNGAGSVAMTPAQPKLVQDALQSGFISLITDPTVCEVLTNMIGVTVNSKSVEVAPKLGEDTVILVNIIGDALPQGTKTLPASHIIQFSVIETKKPAINVKAIRHGLADWLGKC